MSEPLSHPSNESTGAADDAREDGSSSREPRADLGAPTAVESMIGALLEAGPEVAEHVVKAAQELLLAVQVVVDAADRAVQEQQAVRKDRASSPERDDTVRHLDVAE